jgi:hypothetical protein
VKAQSDFIYQLYKPLRNQIRNYYLLDCLYLIWGYSRNFTFNLPLPSDIELPAGFIPNDDLQNRRYRGLPEFEQEFLLREFILNCDPNHTKKSLKQKGNLSKLVNYLRMTFVEEVDKNMTLPSGFLIEFNRMAHRQFKWQTGYNQRVIFRNYKIYSDPEVSLIVKKKFQLTSYEIFILGFFFFRWTAENYRTNLPFRSEFHLISNEMIEVFFKNFSMTMEQAKDELKECQQMNENIFYSYNPLSAKPILIYQNAFMCPIPLLLFWQITGGIYYSIVKESGFENAFGTSFQNYIGEILSKSCTNPNFIIFSEKKYGREEKRTTDWLVIDKDSILFIECKAKRMTVVSKSELDIKQGLESDLTKMASFIVQLYKTYIDYTADKYPQIKYNPSKKFVPLVVTLEEWYINLNPPILEILKELVIKNFIESNLDTSLIDKFPYHIRSSHDFESDIQIINSLGIHNYFDKIVTNELFDYIHDFTYHNIFEGEFIKTFIEPLRAQPTDS